MTLQVEEVLHLYFGQKFQDSQGRILELNNLIKHPGEAMSLGGKLILRPISDLKDEDLANLSEWRIYSRAFAKEMYRNRVQTNTLYTSDVLSFLKMGFDLFNLIGTEQAIDATTLKV